MRNIFSKKNPNSNYILNQFSNAISSVFDQNALWNHEDYLASTIQSIQVITKANVILIGRLNSSNNTIQTLKVRIGNKFVSNLTYFLDETPCEQIIGQEPCSFQDKALYLFQNDKRLGDQKLEGCVGVPLFYGNNIPLGILSVMYNRPIDNLEITKSVLQIYSIHIASNIIHTEDVKKLEQKNEELNQLFESFKDQNHALEDAMNSAEESNLLKNAFLANLSHEIRTPMNVILGFSQLLKTDFLSNSDRDEYIDIINTNGVQLLKIMESLIDISKFQSKKMLLKAQPLKINQLFDSLYDDFRLRISTSHKPIDLKLQKYSQDNDFTIKAFQEGITKVMDHLLDNAFKFTSEGHISFGYTINELFIEFFVDDSGIGIDKGMENSIFDLFRQADLNPSRQFGGNGLGLALVKKYTELMDGEIHIADKKSPGTLMIIKIPMI